MSRRRAGLAILMTVIMIASVLAVPASRSYLEKGASGAEGALVEILPGFLNTFTTATDLGSLPPTANLTVGVSLALPNPGSADAYVYSMYTPGSPTYHQALSPDAFRARFSPSPAAYQTVEDYYAGLGLKTLTTPDRLMLGLEGSSAQVSSAFHTGFHHYRLSDGRIVYGSSAPTYVPGWLPIDGVTGMTDAVAPKPAQVTPTELTAAVDVWKNTTGPSKTSTWSCTSGTQGCDEPGFYGEYPLFNAGDTGAGMSVGIVDAYDSGDTQAQLSTHETNFASGAGLPTPHENFWYPIPGAGNLNSSPSSGWGGETDLDQQVSFMDAPGATIDVTFASDSSFAVYEAVDFLVAHNLTQTISMSWGEADVGTMAAPPQNPCMPYYSCNASWDGSYAFLHPVFAEAVAEGITPFAASGDCGAADGTGTVATDYPGSDPFVVGVGGTVVNATASTYQGESGWSGNGTNCQVNSGGSGGGYAPWAQPWWQHGPGQLTHHLRGVPDVSADSSGWLGAGTGGTSQASPMWAGWMAVADQIHGGGLGLVGPSLYNILSNRTAYATDFHDIKTGNNGYQAGSGWDPVTGMGTPITSALLPALSRYEPPVHGSLNASLSVSPTSGSAPLTVTMTATASGGQAPYSYDFVPGLYLGEWTGSSTLGYTYSAAGVYDASVVVYDNNGNSAISWPVLVNVGGGSLTPTLTASTTTAVVGQTITFTSSPGGGTSPYAFTYYYGDGTYGYNATTTNTHAYYSSGVFCPHVSVTDSASPQKGGMAGPVCITVTQGGVVPLYAAVAANTSLGKTPLTVQFSGSAYGGTPPYSWAWRFGDGTASAVQNPLHTFTLSGNFTTRLWVNDSASQSALGQRDISVTPGPLSIVSFTASPATIPLGGTTYLNVTAQGGTTPYSYLYNNLPAGCTSANTSSLPCSPSATGTYAGVTVSVSTSSKQGVVSNSVSFSVSSPGGPSITSFAAMPAAIPLGGTSYLNVTATGGSIPYTYVYNNLPTGCTSTNTSSLPCSPSSTGTHTGITVTVTDSSKRAATSNPVSISVSTAPPNLAIASFTALPATIPQGGTVYLNVTASGGVGPLTYVYTGLPSPCTTSNSSKITCAPSASGGPYPITVTVSDSASSPHSTTGTASFTVSPLVTGPTISAFTAHPTTLYVGGTLYLNTTATGGTTPYTYVYNGLPSGCTSSSTPTYTCTPTTAASYSISVTVTDKNSLSATSNPASVTVKALPAISAFTVSPKTLFLGGTTYLNVTATGSSTLTYAYSGLPSGCTSANSAKLTCVPAGTGTFSIGITVTDTAGNAASKTASLTVNALPSLPTITAFSASPQSVSVNQSTNFTVVVSGGTTPYTYAYTNLPTGCSSRDAATLPCVPTVAANYVVTVTVTDTAGHSASRNTYLNVSAASTGTNGNNDLLEWVLIAAIAAIAAAVILVMVLRRKKRPTSSVQGWQQPGAVQPWSPPPPPPPQYGSNGQQVYAPGPQGGTPPDQL